MDHKFTWKTETVKLLEQNIEEKLQNIGRGKGFLFNSPKLINKSKNRQMIKPSIWKRNNQQSEDK
jgi:hypothetical protein